MVKMLPIDEEKTPYQHALLDQTACSRFQQQECDELEKDIIISPIYVDASITAKPFFEKRRYKVISQQVVVRNKINLINYKMIKDLN